MRNLIQRIFQRGRVRIPKEVLRERLSFIDVTPKNAMGLTDELHTSYEIIDNSSKGYLPLARVGVSESKSGYDVNVSFEVSGNKTQIAGTKTDVQRAYILAHRTALDIALQIAEKGDVSLRDNSRSYLEQDNDRTVVEGFR